MPSKIVALLSTAPTREAGLELVEALVRERHAACGTVVPGGVSAYWWEGRVVRESEALVLLKTSRDHVDALLARLVELHPYDVPEALTLPVEQGYEPYLNWVMAEVGERG